MRSRLLFNRLLLAFCALLLLLLLHQLLQLPLPAGRKGLLQPLQVGQALLQLLQR
jgi:hypothetical protein